MRPLAPESATRPPLAVRLVVDALAVVGIVTIIYGGIALQHWLTHHA